MASPVAVYPVKWHVKVSDEMAARVRIAAIEAGTPRESWIRQAMEEKLARDERARRKSRSS